MSDVRPTRGNAESAGQERRQPPARPAAGDTRTDRERVRELEDVVADTIHATIGATCGEDEGDTDCYRAARAVLALPELAELLDAAEKVRRVEEALTAEEAYTREVGGYVKVPKSEYGPSEWRLHGDARGRRLVLAEIRRALNGDAS